MKPDNVSKKPPDCQNRYIVYIFLFGLALRVAFFAIMREYPLLYLQSLDESYYLEFGKRIASGISAVDGNSFFMDPLYGYFLGFIFLLFGDNLTVLRLIQILLDSFNIVIVYFIGCKAWDKKAGTVAGLVWSVYVVSFYYTLLVLKVTVAVTGVLLFTLLLLTVSEKNRKTGWFITGLAAGILTYVRANFILLIPFSIMVYWIVNRPKTGHFIKNSVIFLAGATILFSSNAVHNYFVTGSASVLISSSGRILYCCNNPDNVAGIYDVPAFSRSHPEETEKDFHAEAERRLDKKLSPAEVSRYWRTETFRALKDNIHIIPQLFFNKLKWTIANYEIPMNQSYALAADFAGTAKVPFPNYAFVFALGVPGLAAGILLKKRAGWMLVPVLSIITTLMIFYVSSRFRMPMVPFFAIGTGIYISLVFNRIRQKQWPKVLLLIVISLLLFTVSFLISPPLSDGHKEFGVAKALYIQNNMEKAKPLALEAVSKYPKNANLHILMGKIMKKEGSIDQAMQYFQDALQLDSDNFTVNYELAMLYINDGKPENAVLHLKKCLTLKHHAESMLHLAKALESSGQNQEARKYYKAFLNHAESDGLLKEYAKQKLPVTE